jgi:hypothetical protein
MSPTSSVGGEFEFMDDDDFPGSSDEEEEASNDQSTPVGSGEDR